LPALIARAAVPVCHNAARRFDHRHWPECHRRLARFHDHQNRPAPARSVRRRNPFRTTGPALAACHGGASNLLYVIWRADLSGNVGRTMACSMPRCGGFVESRTSFASVGQCRAPDHR
jgi:hypothetical protein